MISWELKDVGFSQLIVHGIDGNCRNEPTGLGWSTSTTGAKNEPLAGAAALGICSPFPAECSPSTAPSNRDSQTPKGVETPDTSRVLAHLHTKCSVITNDRHDNSACYCCYCSCEKKELPNLDIVTKFPFVHRKTFPSDYSKSRVEKELCTIVIKCN